MPQNKAIVTTREGRVVHPHNVLTLCEAQYADQARSISAQFLNNGEPPAAMLNLSLVVPGTSKAYVACERIAYDDEIERQSEFFDNLGLPWVSGTIRQLSDGIAPGLSMYVDDGSVMFPSLGLERVE